MTFEHIFYHVLGEEYVENELAVIHNEPGCVRNYVSIPMCQIILKMFVTLAISLSRTLDADFRETCEYDSVHVHRFLLFKISPLRPFSVPKERAAVTVGGDLMGLGTCHQQAF